MSSGEIARFALGFNGEGYTDNSVNAFVRKGDYVYLATSSSGWVKRAQNSNLYSWNDFCDTDDLKVKSLYVWGNALFAGTEPNGKIFVHNFTSGEEYVAVLTKDQQVSCFCDYNNVLYVGTKPEGYIYTFDGYTWNEVYKASGGINQMVTWGGKLYVVCSNLETVLCFNGSLWKPIAIKNVSYANTRQYETVSSFKISEGYPMDNTTLAALDKTVSANKGKHEIKPKNPEYDIQDAGVVGNGIVFVGKKGRLFFWDGNDITVLSQSGESGNSNLAVVNSNLFLYSVEGKLFVHAKAQSNPV